MNLYGFLSNDGINRWDYLGLILRPGGAVENLNQIPLIMRMSGYDVGAKTMERWFSRQIGDNTPVDDILTVSWAEKFPQFNEAVEKLKSKATNADAAKSLKKTLSDNGLLVTGTGFNHTIGKASDVERYYYTSSSVEKNTEDDFGFAVGRTNIHMVAMGYVGAKNICVFKLGYYIKDSYSFADEDDQRLGVWDFDEMKYEGYIETITSKGEFRIFNRHFVEYSLKYRMGSDFMNYSNIKSYMLDSPWNIDR